MAFEKELNARTNSTCELCGSNHELKSFEVASAPNNGRLEDFILICDTCHGQIENPDTVDVNHWRCLNDSMWSEVPAVQVMAWRMLQRLKNEGWPQDLLDMLYLDDETLSWAKATGEGEDKEAEEFHKDCNGVRLLAGDNVVLIKDLNVKGGGFTAKRGTAVRNISLDHNNPTYIEGKVNGQTIVIITEYVKKS
ncbi:MAG: PhnA domain-containing protein [Crocinitomicaceae bacterium]|nr:PhnA domain-containing protein [Crocinitomicaceae bacterium]